MSVYQRIIGYFFINVSRKTDREYASTPGISRTLRTPSFSSTLRRADDND
jgi:hypothetical protein